MVSAAASLPESILLMMEFASRRLSEPVQLWPPLWDGAGRSGPNDEGRPSKTGKPIGLLAADFGDATFQMTLFHSAPRRRDD